MLTVIVPSEDPKHLVLTVEVAIERGLGVVIVVLPVDVHPFLSVTITEYVPGINPHDRFEMQPGATSGFLKGDLLHYTAETEQAYRKKLQRYAEIAAAELYRNKKSAGWLVVYVKTAANFLKHYLLQRGFMDGAIGWKICKMSAGYTYNKYKLLRQLRKVQ